MIPKISEAHAAHVHESMPINFEFNDPEAVTVHVAGSFNQWSSVANPLTRGYGGRWGTTTSLAPGSYEYCLVVDGRWITDPMNQVSVANEFGGRNSVLNVAESKGAAHLIDAEHEPFQIAPKNGPVGKISGDGTNKNPRRR